MGPGYSGCCRPVSVRFSPLLISISTLVSAASTSSFLVRPTCWTLLISTRGIYTLSIRLPIPPAAESGGGGEEGGDGASGCAVLSYRLGLNHDEQEDVNTKNGLKRPGEKQTQPREQRVERKLQLSDMQAMVQGEAKNNPPPPDQARLSVCPTGAASTLMPYLLARTCIPSP